MCWQYHTAGVTKVTEGEARNANVAHTPRWRCLNFNFQRDQLTLHHQRQQQRQQRRQQSSRGASNSHLVLCILKVLFLGCSLQNNLHKLCPAWSLLLRTALICSSSAPPVAEASDCVYSSIPSNLPPPLLVHSYSFFFTYFFIPLFVCFGLPFYN